MPARALGVQQLEDRALLGVVGARRVARRGADALVSLGDERVVVERLVRRVAPQRSAHPLVEQLRERLREAVGERRGQDRAVVVVVGHEPRPQLLEADAGGHREQAHVIRDTRPDGRGVVRQRHVRPAVGLGHLLAKGVQTGQDGRAARVGVQLDVVVECRCAGQKPTAAFARSSLPLDDPVQQPLGVAEQRPWPPRRPPGRRGSGDTGRPAPRW